MTSTAVPRLPAEAGKFVPVQTRSERLASFTVTDFAVPNGREAEWKRSPVRDLAPLFEDAPGDGSTQVSVDAPAAVEVGTLAPGQAPRGTGFVPEARSEAITAAYATATHVRVTAGSILDAPVTVRVSGAGVEHRDLVHLVLEVQDGAVATIVLEHSGSATLSENVEIIVGDEATATVIALHEWDDDAILTGAHQAVVGERASLQHTLVTFGGDIVRVNPAIHLNGARAQVHARGLYFADAGQHFEHQVYIDHAGPNTVSDVNYKGALQGEDARTVWIGDVLIRPTAVGTNSYEQNRNLVLSNGARADSVPNLEIETGDIEGAGHASATGRFEREQLFYLMARGIDELTARRLVVHGFLNEIVQTLAVDAVRERVAEKLEAELEASTTAMMEASAV